ncbi:MAG TPA: non-homologous end-joining DNA ligase [Ignavibacteriaceae bacterium]|jgi:bifunctional non-homologous end joining protein LigD|nr:non-homologous end-joining DNA ligase [Ignavibacteriaceae bacterium]
MSEELKLGKYTVELSHTDKIFFPDEKYTKGDLINYFKDIANIMVPYLEDRPLVMLRYPDGIKGQSFFHKDAPDYFPDWIKTKPIKKEGGGTVNHIICNSTATLVYIANQGCITPHIWLSKTDKLDYPDTLIFDLDPPGDEFSEVIFAAKKLRDILTGDLGITTFIKTTGSKGVHVEIPLQRKENFDEVREFGRKVSKILSNRYPDRLTTEVRKNKRKGRVFLDAARNGYAQTAVAPYAVRAKPGAPVAVPIEWDELNSSMSPQKYNIKNIFRRLSQKKDPWKDFRKHRTAISEASEKADEMLEEVKSSQE